MRASLLILIPLAGLSSAAIIPTCARDNCYRQVRATAFPSRSTSADCSSYQTTISGSATVTRTVFILPGRTPSASTRTIPSYASSCTNDAAYRSACFCIGYPSTSEFVARATTTTTKVCPSIVVQATSGVYAGNYFQDGIARGARSPAQFLSGTTPLEAQRYEYRDGRLLEPPTGTPQVQRLLYAEANDTGPVLLEQANSFGPGSPFVPLNCTFGNNDALICRAQGGMSRIFQYNEGIPDDFILFGPRVDQFGVVRFVPRAIPACLVDYCNDFPDDATNCPT